MWHDASMTSTRAAWLATRGTLDGEEVCVGPDGPFAPLDRLVQRLDRLSGLRARRQRREAEEAGRSLFTYELGRWVAPVAERCGYGEPQVGGSSVTFCGDPAEVLARQPWVEGEVYRGPGSCVDLHVEWRDGWIELRADPFVRHARLAPAEDRQSLGSALRDVAQRVATALDDEAVIVGTGPWDDPRPSDGSRGYLRD